MLATLTTALGGIQRSQMGMQVTATNIANVHTDGYRTQRYDAATDTVRDAGRLPEERPDDWPESHPYNDVDLASEFVHMKRYEVGVLANAKVVSMTDELLGEFMDEIA